MAATEIGMCASDGLISTRLNESTYGNTWMITQDGLAAMEGIEDVLGPRH